MAEISFDVDKKELFHVLVDLLAEFDRVCKENDIRYFVVAGTMLGAIRHHGIIPWDDDIDVVVLRKDYERLKKCAANGAFKMPYFFQNPSTDEGYPKGFSRLRNSNTTQIPYRDIASTCNRGIFIDIIPLDVIPGSEKLRKKQITKLFNYKMIMNSFSRYYSGIGTEGTTKKRAIAYYLILPLFKCHVLTMKGLFRQFEKTVSKYEDSNEEYVGLIACTYGDKRFIWKRELWNTDPIWVDFEGMKVPVPQTYDAILRNSYGEYMTPVKEPNNHGDAIYSLDTPYDLFVKEHYSELKAIWLREIANPQTHKE